MLGAVLRTWGMLGAWDMLGATLGTWGILGAWGMLGDVLEAWGMLRAWAVLGAWGIVGTTHILRPLSTLCLLRGRWLRRRPSMLCLL